MGSWRWRLAPLSRPAAIAAALLSVIALAGDRLIPLLQVPGYELSMVACCAAALLGAPLGIGAARRERELPVPSPAGAWVAASMVLAAVLVLFFAVSALRAFVASACSPLAGAVFFPVLAFPSGLLAASLGVACGFASQGRRLRAGLLYAFFALGSLTVTLLELYRGPAVYAFNPLLGYWPGPIYDEGLEVDGRLLFARLGALALAAALVAVTELAVLDFRRRRGRALVPVLVLGLALLLGAGVQAGVAALGYPSTREGVAAALGGRREGRLCVIVYPEEKRPEEVERLLRDCEFDARQVARDLGIAAPLRPTVYVYRSDEEKRRLVGAAGTDFAKPWLGEIHVTDRPLPHAVLRHELVHALAAGFGRGPLRVPARYGLLISAGLVEGLAVAVDLPRGEWTTHEWARAMRDLGLMPPVGRIMEPASFFSAAPARAYTVAGSFLRYLQGRFGPAKVRALYTTGDFAQAFGEPLAALAGEWSGFLDGVAAPPALLAAAESRFREEGLLGRRCVREVADIESRAARRSAEHRPAEAAELWRRAAALSGEPADLRATGDEWRNAGELARAGDAYREALTQAGNGRRAFRASLEESLGDLKWRSGDLVGAGEKYRAALALDPERGRARSLRAKLAALADPALAEAAAGWLLQSEEPAVSLARLARSRAPLSAYLLGRAFLMRNALGLALAELAIAARATLPDRSFELETRRMLGEAHCRLGSWQEGIDEYRQLAATAERAADRLRATDDAERCAFERDTYGAPVRSAGDGADRGE